MNVHDNRPMVLGGTATWQPVGPFEWRDGVPVWDLEANLGDPNAALWPLTGHSDAQLVRSAILSGIWSGGPFEQALEEFYAREAGASHASAFVSATSAWMAIFSALQEYGAGERKRPAGVPEVIMSALTSGETAVAAALCNLRTVVVDVEPCLGILSVEAVAEAVTPSTRIVIAGPHHGWCPDMAALIKFCRKRRLLLVADASHAPLGLWEDEPWADWAHVVGTSLGPSMPWTAGAGGMVATKDRAIAALVAQARDGGPHAATIGSSARGTEMGAALALAQLEVFRRQQRVRELNWAQLQELVRSADLTSFVPFYRSPRAAEVVGWAGFFNESDVPTGALRLALSRQLTVQVTSTMPPLSHPDSGFTAASVGERFAHLGIELDPTALPNAYAVHETAVVLPPAFWVRLDGPRHLIDALLRVTLHERELVEWALRSA